MGKNFLHESPPKVVNVWQFERLISTIDGGMGWIWKAMEIYAIKGVVMIGFLAIFLQHPTKHKFEWNLMHV